MKEISLTQGKFAIVDDDMWEELSQYKWYAHKNYRTFYAERMIPKQKGKSIFMHTQIMGFKGVDHINHNGLDNRRGNLRKADNNENACNRRKRNNCSSPYVGVSFHKGTKKWQATIMHQGKRVYIGLFSIELEAAQAYDAKAKELHEEFAKFNFPESSNKSTPK